MQTMIRPEIGSILDGVLGQVRQEISSICDSEGDPIRLDEVERAIVHLLQTHLEDCRFQDEIQEWLDNLRFRM
jgi:hypothetical protein